MQINWLEGLLPVLHSRAMAEDTTPVVFYYRKGCHLCHVVKESLAKLSRLNHFAWQEVDVDSSPELRRQFTDEVPVVYIHGRKAFKYRMDEKEFLHKLAARDPVQFSKASNQ